MIIGADPHELRRLSENLSDAADTIALSHSRISRALGGVWWRGPSSERFARTWRTTHGPALRQTQALLQNAGRTLDAQAAQQEDASSARTGAASIASSGAEAAERTPGFSGTFVASQRVIRSRIDQLRQAERAELAERDKWYRIGGLLHSGRRLRGLRSALEGYEGLLGEGRQIMLLGDGRVAEVFGDLDSAHRVGIWVPGVGTGMSDFSRPDDLAAKRIWDADPSLAMIEWLGYDPPATIPDAALELGHAARRAGDELNSFVSHLKDQMAPDSEVIIGGHSYGSVVAAYAASAGTRAKGLVLAGSPGVPVAGVADFTLDNAPGSSANVAVVTNRFDPVSTGHLADEGITAALGSAASLYPLSAPVGLLARVAGGNDFDWWSEMSHDPGSAGFGATILPSNETRPEGALTGVNHRYADPGTVSLDSLRLAFWR